MEPGLKTGVPVLSVSMTPHHVQPTTDDQAFTIEHLAKEWREAAYAALEVMALHRDQKGIAKPA